MPDIDFHELRRLLDKGPERPPGLSRKERRLWAREHSLPRPLVCPVCKEPKPKSRQWVVPEDESRVHFVPVCRACHWQGVRACVCSECGQASESVPGVKCSCGGILCGA